VPWGPGVHLIRAGGPTYLAIAILRLATDSPECLTEGEKRQTLRWLLQNQDESGGFRGRLNKDADACYCFWCGAAIQVSFSPRTSKVVFHGPSGQALGAAELVDATALASFLGSCQFRFGGIAKAPGENAGRFPEPVRCNCMMGKKCFRSISHISLSRRYLHVSAT